MALIEIVDGSVRQIGYDVEQNKKIYECKVRPLEENRDDSPTNFTANQEMMERYFNSKVHKKNFK